MRGEATPPTFQMRIRNLPRRSNRFLSHGRDYLTVVSFLMKTLAILIALTLVGVVFSGCANIRQNTAQNGRPVRLQIVVDIPTGMDALRDDEVAEAFGYRVASSLHEQGFRGRLEYVEWSDDLRPNVPVLAISLREWRVDRIGNVDCTFTAELRTPSGRHHLGLFTGSSIMYWARRDWYARAQGFEDAAVDALSNLAARIEKTGELDRSLPRQP